MVKKLVVVIFGVLFNNSLPAQLCQGSLGDAVVNITFGAGQGFGTPLKSTLTNYKFVSNICPDDGFYTIAGSTNNCFGGTWHDVSEDHTPGDINGYMMIVNASFDPGDFYLDTVKGLCGGTTYEFAAWLVNVLNFSACSGAGIRPNITFNIETTAGNILATNTTGDINVGTPTWSQYGLFFTTPSGISSVVIRMTNNAPGGCGNDILLDDITFRPCGPKVRINIKGSSNTINVCTGNEQNGYTFSSSIVAGYPNTFYQWQASKDSISWTDIPGANKSTYSIPALIKPGKYFFRLAVADGGNISISSCRIASDVANININPLPVPLASNNGPRCSGEDIKLTAANGNIYSWSGPGNFTSNSSSPVITNTSVNNSGIYYVKVTSESGCVNTDSTAMLINLSPVADAGNDVDICEGVPTKLQGSGIRATSYIWTPTNGLSDFFSATPLATPEQTTLYILTVSDGKCKNSDSVLVQVEKKPTANAGADKVTLEKQFATLDGEAGGMNVNYFWTPDIYLSSSSSLNPQVSPPNDITYTLHVLSNIGCGSATDEVNVKFYKDVFIPNAFTPNNDGLNDQWNIPVLPAFPLAEVSIYNRYGQLIFYDKGYTKQWDGKFKGIPQSSGVYPYLIDLKNGFKKFSGTVTLIR